MSEHDNPTPAQIAAGIVAYRRWQRGEEGADDPAALVACIWRAMCHDGEAIQPSLTLIGEAAPKAVLPLPGGAVPLRDPGRAPVYGETRGMPHDGRTYAISSDGRIRLGSAYLGSR